MVTIYIDNKPYQVKEGQNLLQACLSLGFDLPTSAGTLPCTLWAHAVNAL